METTIRPRLRISTVTFVLVVLTTLVTLAGTVPALAQRGDGPGGNGGDGGAQIPPSDQNPTSPVRRLDRNPQPPAENPAPTSPFRSLDGSGNNVDHPEVGAASTQLLRLVGPDYGDGLSSMAGDSRPSARAVSNAVCDQGGDRPNRLGVSDYLWQWGQFLDHDIDLTDGVEPPEPADIRIPTGDAWFDPQGSGTAVMAFNRSLYDPETGGANGPFRQQMNEISAWIDASNVYGSDTERAAALRTLDGTGELATSDGDLLPWNVQGLPNAGGPAPTLFLAGDVRANEQVGLTAMHTLFVREHNRQARRIRRANPELSGDQIYQRARRIVGALMQKITYDEFLPALLGPNALAPYQGYRENLDAGIANLFSTAAYRFGHSTLSPTILRLDADGAEHAAGHLELRDAFFRPDRLVEEGGIEPILRGLARQVCQAVDPYVVDDLRNFLFGPPGSGGFDLASLNIQRGRDHGLPSYNDVREAYGLPRAQRFADITTDRQMIQRLRAAYASVDEIDLWVGGLAEPPRQGAMVGELLYRVIREQFEALRDGDRFWWQRSLPERERQAVDATSLADVIRRNTVIGGEIQDDVFRVPAGD